ncbi:MAG: AAA family ATPase [Opitutales bacterium]|nr:AAA family ATPase [Opitutales bacterium]MCH8539919.1 zeta toxin [Opitutales bacterium]
MKKILIIAGPNGAGKTTFAEEFLPNEAACLEFVNADLIAAGISPFQPEKVAILAGRIMLLRIKELAASGKSFGFETTLASRSYVRMIPEWKLAGYQVRLCFLKLPDPDIALRRVAQRVALGGHSIPEETIRRRYARGWENLRNRYLKLVDQWALYDASKTPPMLIETGENPSDPKLMEDATPYPDRSDQSGRVQPLNIPDFIGAEAALRRASAKAIARARAAGLEPVVDNTPMQEDYPSEFSNRDD